METLFLGVDVSKGYADMQMVNEAGSLLPMVNRVDDTAEGHEKVRRHLQEQDKIREEVHYVIGVEDSGGLERNWVRFFKELKEYGLSVKVYKLNPLAVKRFLERKLHRNINDRISARGIAHYLREGLRAQDENLADPEWDGRVTLYRTIRGFVLQSGKLKTRIQSLLPLVHPDLVQFCRNGIPRWAMRLLSKYPTAAQLAKARPSSVAIIPFITKERARQVVNDAKQSVASQRDAGSGMAMGMMVKESIRLEKSIEKMKSALINQMKSNEDIRIGSNNSHQWRQ